MNGIPENISNLLKEVGANSTDVWEVRKNTWVVKHKALERIAAHLDIKFDSPKIIHSDMESKQVAIEVSGSAGENTAWSIGEAAPYNNKNAYPFAMAEKRAKDRVILKLAGIHGDAYSEEEADDFKESEESEAEREVKKLIVHNEAWRNNEASIYFIKLYINMDEPKWENVAEAWGEISKEDQQALWIAPSKGGVFTTAERAALRSDECNAAMKVMGVSNE
jgi:hypothetical protein